MGSNTLPLSNFDLISLWTLLHGIWKVDAQSSGICTQCCMLAGEPAGEAYDLLAEAADVLEGVEYPVGTGPGDPRSS